MSVQAASTLVDSDSQARYADEGYLVLRGVFDGDEIAALDRETAALWWERQDLTHVDNIRCRWQDHVETGECLFECFDPVIDLSPACRRIAHDPRILDALAAIYHDPAHLFKDKLIYKPPGAKGYGLHQDYIAWPSFPKTFTTVLVAIDPADEENGATEVFPGLHKSGCLSQQDGMYHELPPASVATSRGVKLDLKPGDIAIFGCFTPHCSAPNRSDRWRRQLYLSYNSAADGGERREEHYREFHAWLTDRYAEYGKTGVYFK